MQEAREVWPTRSEILQIGLAQMCCNLLNGEMKKTAKAAQLSKGQGSASEESRRRGSFSFTDEYQGTVPRLAHNGKFKSQKLE